MKNTEFSNFMENIKNYGLESNEIQSAGYAWLALTAKQVKTIVRYAVDSGYRPNKRGALKFGNYVFTLDNEWCDEIAAHDNENKENTEMKKTENETPVVEETTAPAPVTDGDTTPAVEEVDEKKVNAAIARVEKKVAGIEKGYLGIIGDVAYLHDTKAHKVTKHKDFYALCADKFHMSRGSVSNILNVYERFGDGNYHLADENKDRSLRSMLEQIQNEKNARKGIENKVGESVVDADEDEDGATNGSKSTKHETIVDFDFTNVDAWSLDDLLDKIREELGNANISEIAANANIIFKITT